MIPLARMPTGQQAFIFTLLCRSDPDEVAWVTISKLISFSTLATWPASTQVWGLCFRISCCYRSIVTTFSVFFWLRRIESFSGTSRKLTKNCQKPGTTTVTYRTYSGQWLWLVFLFSLVIHTNPRESWPSLFLCGLLWPFLFLFSSFKYYFWISFALNLILYITKTVFDYGVVWINGQVFLLARFFPPSRDRKIPWRWQSSLEIISDSFWFFWAEMTTNQST